MALNMQAGYQIIQQDEYKRMPWKNGLGETLEIYTSGDKNGLRFRISQAAVVENGEFSNFVGLHRTLVLLSGNGMTLVHSNGLGTQTESHLESALDIARFAGGDKTTATLLDDRIEDLNIMVRETDTKAEVVAYFDHSLSNQSRDITINEESVFNGFYANQTCQIRLGEHEVVTLTVNSFLLIKQETRLCLVKGSGVFIRIIDLNGID